MQTMQVPAHTAYCRWQECSNEVVVVILNSPRLYELEFATHTASGPGDSCAHFQRRAYFAAD